MAAIAFLALNQLIWTGYAVYFGQALSPEHLILFQHEAADTVIGVLADWRSLLPWLITLLAGSAVLAAIQWVVSFKDRYNIRVLNVSLAADSTESYLTDPLCALFLQQRIKGFARATKMVITAVTQRNHAIAQRGLMTQLIFNRMEQT